MKSRNTEMPNLFVIGAAKCGTSSLHEYLDMHPDISMSDIKEPRYFMRHCSGLFQPVVSERDAYLDLFEPETTIRGESSVGYTAWPGITGIPKAIAAETSEPKFIYLVRDPVEMVLSGLVQMQSDSWFPNDSTGTRISLERLLEDPQEPLRSKLLHSGMFMTQLRQYCEFFPKESILVIDSDDLRFRRHETLSRVFAFLGVDPEFREAQFADEFNAGATLRRKSDLYRSLVRIGWLRELVYRLPREPRRKAIETVSRPLSSPLKPVVPNAEQRIRLESIFRFEVDQLRAFTGEEFAGWSL